MRAAEKYDPATGNRFVTYARFWILQSLGRFADQWALPLRLPDHRADQLRKIRSAIIDNKNSDPAGLSSTTGLDQETIKLLLPFSQGSVSLDAPIRTPCGEEGESFGDLLLTVTEDYIEKLQSSELRDVLEKLPQRQREVLLFRSGAFGYQQMTLQEIANMYGITRERVRQIETQALTACRRLMSEND